MAGLAGSISTLERVGRIPLSANPTQMAIHATKRHGSQALLTNLQAIMKRNSKNPLNPLAQAVNEIDQQELRLFLEYFQAHIDENGGGIEALLSITLGPQMGSLYEYMLNEMVFDVFSGNMFDYFDVTPLSLTTAAPGADHHISMQHVVCTTCDADSAPAQAQYTQSLQMHASGYERPFHISETDATDVLHVMPAPPQLPLPPLPPQIPLPALPADPMPTFAPQPGGVAIDVEQALCDSYPPIYLHGNFTLVGLHAAWQHLERSSMDNSLRFAPAYAVDADVQDTSMNEVVSAGLDGPSGPAPEVEISYYLMSVACDALSF